MSGVSVTSGVLVASGASVTTGVLATAGWLIHNHLLLDSCKPPSYQNFPLLFLLWDVTEHGRANNVNL